MADTTVIGRAAFVRGRVNGTGDLEIAGRVEGEVEVGGEVLVDASGLVAASINAKRIVVRGAVKGDLTADEALVLESGAKVVGDLRAPRIAIAAGGLVRGHVQTGAAGAGAPRARTTAAARPATSSAASSAKPVTTASAAKATHAGKAPPPPQVRTNHVAKKGAPRGATLAGARPGPPPPVVPALKKGTKAVQKKR